MTLEANFDITFTASLALREKQIQQNYRPIIGVHKWFARRPGTVFRNLLLAEFNGHEPIATGYWRTHNFFGVIADPFMGGGTPIYEANRLGFSVVGTDVNPMAYWIVRQALAPIDIEAFMAAAEAVIADVEHEIGALYRTECVSCRGQVDVKYFLWVKEQACPACGAANDLFPGYLLAEATRHPRHVVACGRCGALGEYERQPSLNDPAQCGECGHAVHVEGPARRGRIACRACEAVFNYPPKIGAEPPRHRMWAIEYHCPACKPRRGRFFKRPDSVDLARYDQARTRLNDARHLLIPIGAIPAGDETDRLHRWGYHRYREMFNDRQLLGLGLLLERVRAVDDIDARHALLTVFSDFLRYQNMLCRYDTYALKCQDIFSVHGFPVGLVQCENSLVGIPGIGSGAFRHFVEKYAKAKRYCAAPFETRQYGGRKEVVYVEGERIGADFVSHWPQADARQAKLLAASATHMPLPPASLDGVFTDPPYFDNVQYAELMDFCFVWLRLGIQGEMPAFQRESTRTPAELTGNDTMGRGIDHFTDGLSNVFRHYAAALKPGAPFVFTYHHNAPIAYIPLVVAVLDAGLDCTASLPVPAEMGASLHIAKTGSSVLDSVFVCRARPDIEARPRDDLPNRLRAEVSALAAGGVRVTEGDIRCLLAGHVARLAINCLRATWDGGVSLTERMRRAGKTISELGTGLDVSSFVVNIPQIQPDDDHQALQYEAALR
jgi:adenine-specific DNA methylase